MKIEERIFEQLKSAQAMVILTGAGMGVDSGLATYRGEGGQWGNVQSKEGKTVFELVNSDGFKENPKFIWEMFAQRYKEYKEALPHKGFDILKEWISRFDLDYFVITSNIDGMFQKAGFNPDKIRELHGSVHYLQCSRPCNNEIWENKIAPDELIQNIEQEKFPQCPQCGKIARPNVYMFRDRTFLPDRTNEQNNNFQLFLEKNKGKKLIAFEIGSGPHVQSIRQKTRMLRIKHGANIIRINPKDYKIKEPHIGIDKGALQALKEINDYIA